MASTEGQAPAPAPEEEEEEDGEPEGDKSNNTAFLAVPPTTSWAGTTVASNTILYHGGSLMVGGVNVYIIW